MRESLERFATRTTAGIVGVLAVAAAIIALVVASGAHNVEGTPSADTPVRTVHVVLDLLDPEASSVQCDTSATGYSDVASGGQVSVVDRAGTVLATGTFGAGTDEGDGSCEFTADVPRVDAYLPAYGVTFGNQNRGTINSTRDELSTNAWTFELTLGDD